MRETKRALLWAGGLSIAAGLLHMLVIEEHLAEWWGYGVFFMLAMLAQGVYGFAIVGTQVMEGKPISEHWRPSTRKAWYVAGIVGNAFLVVLYVFSRAVAIPAGPAAGETEAVTPFGVFVKLVEVALVVVLLLLYRSVTEDARSPSRTAP